MDERMEQSIQRGERSGKKSALSWNEPGNCERT